MDNALSKISTHWEEIEDRIEKEGPSALIGYLYARYYEALVSKVKQYCFAVDDLRANEIASDVFYEFINNDYRLTKKLDSRRQLRGLFYRIMKAKLSRLGKGKKEIFVSEPELKMKMAEEANSMAELSLDIAETMAKLKAEKPRLYPFFVLRFIEGKKIREIAEHCGLKEDAVKYRLKAMRNWIENSPLGRDR